LKIVNSIFKICEKTKIKPLIAEFEDIERGKIGAKEIRAMISHADLFLVFLSENVFNEKDLAKTVYTQNWVNFELGCAYSQKATFRQPICVFEPFNQLRFPIPYLDYYILYDPNYDAHWDYIEQLIAEEVDWKKLTSSLDPLVQMIRVVLSLQERLKGHPLKRPLDASGWQIYHKDCGAKYILLSKPEKWYCPVCRQPTNWMP